jgi:hypothetical protein
MKKPNSTLRVISFSIFAIAFTLAIAAGTQAQATRTWVSGVGSDSNPCSRTAPCRTFSAAHAATAVNGEISVIDQGSYGTVTITKSITIDGTGTFAGILSSGISAAITINITDATDAKKTVRLRGLSINGSGGASGPNTGLRGIRVQSALAVHVEDCVIDAVSQDGIEVNITTAMVTELHVRNTVIRNCVSDGVSLTATNASGLVLATFDNTQLSNNGTGLNANQRSRASLRNCTVTANATNGITVGGTVDTEVKIVESTLSYNPSGVLVNLGIARVAQSLITGNTNGLNNVGGTIETYQNNQLRGNTNNTVGSVLPVLET